MIGGHAKVKVFLPEHDDYLDVFMKNVKDGRSAITRGWTRVMRAFAWRRAQYGHSTSPCSATRIYFASFFTVFNSTSIQLSLYNHFRYLKYSKHFTLATHLCSHCHRSRSFVVLPKTRQISGTGVFQADSRHGSFTCLAHHKQFMITNRVRWVDNHTHLVFLHRM